jgi:Ca2+-binding EF-hand superfamily protein
LASLGPDARNEPIYQLILDFDAEGAGHIPFEQFIHLLTPRLIEGDSAENIAHIFALFDTERTGFISARDLRRIAHQMGEELSEEDIADMIKRADADQDGVVSREEFFELIGGHRRE